MTAFRGYSRLAPLIVVALMLVVAGCSLGGEAESESGGERPTQARTTNGSSPETKPESPGPAENTGSVTERASAEVGEDGLHVEVGRYEFDAPSGVAPEGTTVEITTFQEEPYEVSARGESSERAGIDFRSLSSKTAVGSRGAELAQNGGTSGITLRNTGQGFKVDTPEGVQLEKPFQVSFSSNEYGGSLQNVEANEPAPVLLREQGNGLVWGGDVSYDEDKGIVGATFNEVGKFSIGALMFANETGGFMNEVADQMFTGGTPRPECHEQPIETPEGGTVSVDAPAKTVWACLEEDGENVVVTLTNDYPSPLIVRSDSPEPLQYPDGLSPGDEYAIEYVRTSLGKEVLPAKGSATLTFPVDSLPASIELSTDLEVASAMLYGRGLESQATSFGGPLLSTYSDAQGGRECFDNVLLEDYAAGTACTATFAGKKAKTVGAVIRVGEVAGTLTGQLMDEITGPSTVTIDYEPPPEQNQNNDESGVRFQTETYPVGTSPYSIAASGLDGDGNTDLAIVNGDSDNVSVLLNNGDGSFSSPAGTYQVGKDTSSITAADLDGDNDMDLATASLYSDNVSVLINDGDGTFSSAEVYPVGRAPSSVAAADFDGDGDTDLVTANLNSDNVSVLLNNGDGTFAEDKTYPVGNNIHSVTAADFDGDGDTDLAISDDSSEEVFVLLNDGDGAFAEGVNYQVGDNPEFLTSADLDGDGDTDLATVNAFSNDDSEDANNDSNDFDSVSVLLNNGDGTFAEAVNYPVEDNPLSVAASDLDGDGDTDLATANTNSNNVSVLLGDGDGTFSPAGTHPVGEAPESVTASDLDGDSDTDLAVANGDSANVSVLINTAGTGVGTSPSDDGGDSGEGSPQSDPEEEAEEAIRGHYEAIGEADFEEAYSYFGPTYKGEVSKEDWIAEEESYEIESSTIESIEVEEVSGEEAAATVVVGFEDNTGTPRFEISWGLAEVDGEWKLDEVTDSEELG